jgi:hypothetical protein
MRCAFISDFYIHQVLLVCVVLYIASQIGHDIIDMDIRLGVLAGPANIGYSGSFPRWSL